MEYCCPYSPSTKKFKTVLWAWTVMLATFWDARGKIYIEFLTMMRMVINSKTCYETFHSIKLHIHTIRAASTQLFCLHHNTVKPHCCWATKVTAMSQIHTCSMPSLQSRFTSIWLLVIPKIERDVKRSTFFYMMPKLKLLYGNGLKANFLHG